LDTTGRSKQLVPAEENNCASSRQDAFWDSSLLPRSKGGLRVY
jgi:hypothetical protein